MKQFVLAVAMLSAIGTSVSAQPNDEQMSKFAKDANRIAGCEAVAGSQMRLSVMTTMMIAASAPENVKKDEAMAFYLQKANDAAKMIGDGDNVLKKMSSDLGLDIDEATKTSDKMVNQIDAKISIGLTNAAMDPNKMALLVTAIQHDVASCSKWLNEKSKTP